MRDLLCGQRRRYWNNTLGLNTCQSIVTLNFIMDGTRHRSSRGSRELSDPFTATLLQLRKHPQSEQRSHAFPPKKPCRKCVHYRSRRPCCCVAVKHDRLRRDNVAWSGNRWPVECLPRGQLQSKTGHLLNRMEQSVVSDIKPVSDQQLMIIGILLFF